MEMIMTKITESEIEKFAIELLEKQGYQYIYASSIAPDSEISETGNPFKTFDTKLFFCYQ